jgi:hypothetical protein
VLLAAQCRPPQTGTSMPLALRLQFLSAAALVLVGGSTEITSMLYAIWTIARRYPVGAVSASQRRSCSLRVAGAVSNCRAGSRGIRFARHRFTHRRENGIRSGQGRAGSKICPAQIERFQDVVAWLDEVYAAQACAILTAQACEQVFRGARQSARRIIPPPCDQFPTPPDYPSASLARSALCE